MTSLRLAIASIAAAAGLTEAAFAGGPALADLAFLEGAWTSDRSGFVIEETWTNESGGVVVGSSRGVQNGAVRFLRFAVVERGADGVVMRFKRFNADYSTWETDGPSVMRLVESDDGVAIFKATDEKSDVQQISYRRIEGGGVAVVANRVDKDGPYLVEFTLTPVR